MPFLIILMSFAYFLELYQLFGLGSTGFTISDAVTFGMFIYFLKVTLWDGKEMKIAKNPAIFFLLFFFLATFISGLSPLFRGDKGQIIQFIKSTAHYHFTVLFLTINILLNNKNETWSKFIKFWLIISIFINVFGIYQIFARAYGLPFGWMEISNASYLSRGMYDTLEEVPQISLRFENFFRATSIFSEPSGLAGFNGIILVFMLIPFVQKQKLFFKSNFLNVTIFVFSLLGLLLAFSLTGLSCFALVILSIVFFEKLKNLSIFLKAFVIMAVVIVLADQIVASYTGISVIGLFIQRVSGVIGYLATNKLSDVEGESFSGRTDNVYAMFNIFTHNPVLGTGFGLTYSSPYSDGWLFADITLMAVLAELGILGFIGFFGMFTTLILITSKFLFIRKSLADVNSEHRRLLLMSFYIMVVYFVVNYMSGNQIVNVFSLILLSIVFNTTNNYYIDVKNSFYILRFTKVPWKYIFQQGTNSFVTNKKIMEKDEK